MIELRPGVRLRSAVCTTEVVVVRPAAVELRCGGRPMVVVGDPPPASLASPGLALAHAAGTELGKRYADPASGLEVLCTKGGEGSLALGDAPLLRKDAKPLPSSD